MLVDEIFNKIIETPLIGNTEKDSLRVSFDKRTSESEKWDIVFQIKFNYCTDEFLESQGIN